MYPAVKELKFAFDGSTPSKQHHNNKCNNFAIIHLSVLHPYYIILHKSTASLECERNFLLVQYKVFVDEISVTPSRQEKAMSICV